MAERFVCAVDAKYRSACADSEYQATGYCVLHFPSEDKEDDFKRAKERKLAHEAYDFGGAVFPKGTSNFRRHLFDTDVTFAGATFYGEADFSKATFRSEANFRKATFRSEADFSEAAFEGEARFREATFKEKGDFAEANFEKQAGFREATFEKEVRFNETIFKEEARFRRATFKSSVEFEAPSNEDTDEAHTDEAHVFDGRANFSRARFGERVTFVGASTFDVNQRDVTFRHALTEKPELFILDRVEVRPSWFIDMDARKLRFTNVEWRGLLGGPPGRIGDEISAIRGRREGISDPHKVLAKTCRELSSNAEDDRDYPLANEFHYWSMDALRKQSWRKGLGLIGTLYWALSGYGVRAGRALGVLATIAVVFAVLYMIVGHPSLRVLPIEGIWQALADAGQAVMYSLGVMARLRPEPIPQEMGPFQMLVTVEGILGPLQIALLALAIRRKVMR